MESGVMGPFDIPELLIGMSILAILAWAIFNRTHPGAGEHK
jgi:hypothetical protein